VALSFRTRAHRVFDGLLTVFAVLVLPSIVIEAVDDNASYGWAALSFGLDWFIWSGFAIALIGVFVVVDDRRTALRNHALDVALAVLTVPLVPDAWQALRALRALRLLRLLVASFRLRRLVRRATRASVVGPAAVTLLVILLSAATAVRLLEPEQVPSVGHGLWWALSRATALGDGGVALTSAASRAVELGVVLSGLAFLSLITAAIATVFVRSDESTDPTLEGLEAIAARLERIEQQLSRARDSHG
jgi:voltage-gated potassium channel